jgi:hypothetical protein
MKTLTKEMQNSMSPSVALTLLQDGNKRFINNLKFFVSPYKNENNEPLQIFLDIDPDIFVHILNKLRHSKYVLPNDENIDILCDYLGIEMVKNVVIPEPLSIKRAVVEEHYLTTWSTSLDISCKNRIIEVILTDNIDTITRIDILFNPQTPKVSEYIYRIFHSTMEVFFDGPFENKKRLKTYKLKEYYINNLNY